MAKATTKLKAVKTPFNGTVTIKRFVPNDAVPNITISRCEDHWGEGGTADELCLEDSDGICFYIPIKNVSEVIKGLEKFL